MPVAMLNAKDTSCRNQAQTLAKGLFQVSSISLTILIRSRRSSGGIGSFTSTGRIRRPTIPGTAITSKRSRTRSMKSTLQLVTAEGGTWCS